MQDLEGFTGSPQMSSRLSLRIREALVPYVNAPPGALAAYLATTGTVTVFFGAYWIMGATVACLNGSLQSGLEQQQTT